jgi:putative DNA primase/helicase
LHQWVLWKYKKPKRPGQKWRKVPHQPNGSYAETDDSKTWSTFEEVRAAYANGGFDGIGYVFDGAPGPDALCYVGIDFDDCLETGVNAKRQIKPNVKALVTPFNSYTEVSVSGTGLHTIIRAKLAHAATGYVSGNRIEIYSTLRYFAFTGCGTGVITARDTELQQLVAQVQPAGNPAAALPNGPNPRR